MITRRLPGLAAAALVSLAAAHPASAQTYTALTNFTKNGGNIQKNLQASFPSGSFTANNSFATPFQITSDATGNNFAAFGGGASLTINVGLYGVSDVYTLLNAYGPNNGSQIASVEFLGGGGADQTFSLIAGTDIRDFYQGGYANGINGTTTQNAYSVVGPGAAGTGNVSTGSYGTYVVDEQDFHLSAPFATQTLDSIKITSVNGSPVLLGVTASAPVPEASTTVSLGLLLALGFGGVLVAAKRKKAAR